MANELRNALTDFVRFAQTLRGDEKSEAQSFLDRFFRALGHEGVIEAGATFEFRVAKKPGSPQLELIRGNGAALRAKGGKKLADSLWPDRVLIEIKYTRREARKILRPGVRRVTPIFLLSRDALQYSFRRTGLRLTSGMPTLAQTSHPRPSSRADANRLDTSDRAAHDWYRFVLSFPPHLVRDYLGRFGVDSSTCVLDPFCGTGTTLVECKKLGIPSVGIEAHPMSYFGSVTKLDWSR